MYVFLQNILSLRGKIFDLNIHSYSTMQSSRLLLPRVKSNLGKNMFPLRRVKIFNELPTNIITYLSTSMSYGFFEQIMIIKVCLKAMDIFLCFAQTLHLDSLFPSEGEHNKWVYQLLTLKEKWIGYVNKERKEEWNKQSKSENCANLLPGSGLHLLHPCQFVPSQDTPTGIWTNTQ